MNSFNSPSPKTILIILCLCILLYHIHASTLRNESLIVCNDRGKFAIVIVSHSYEEALVSAENEKIATVCLGKSMPFYDRSIYSVSVQIQSEITAKLREKYTITTLTQPTFIHSGLYVENKPEYIYIEGKNTKTLVIKKNTHIYRIINDHQSVDTIVFIDTVDKSITNRLKKRNCTIYFDVGYLKKKISLFYSKEYVSDFTEKVRSLKSNPFLT